MTRRRLVCLLFLPQLAATRAPALEEAEVRPLLEAYCFKCHGGGKEKGGIHLGDFRDAVDVWRDRRTWMSVRDAVLAGTMPPEDAKELPQAERAALSGWIGHTLDHVDIDRLALDPGYVPPRRLNRTEFRYTVDDLFGIESSAYSRLPADQVSEGGFDNEAAMLATQPLLVEKYLQAADVIIGEVWNDRAAVERLIFEAPPAAAQPQDFKEPEAAKRVLARFLSRAFRREPTNDELDRYGALFQQARALGDDYHTAMKLPVKTALVSPAFLFRSELAQPGGEARRISSPELASRLSYFLWSSMPDERLSKLGAEGKLADAGVLNAEVTRMLQDPRALRMSRHFGAQWLRIDGLGQTIRPDKEKFPQADAELLEAMKQESVLFLYSVFTNDLPLRTLLDADFTYANQRLAEHYGIPGITGSEMRRVGLGDSARDRGGVLTQASVLTVTSSPRRSSPVFRGKWILDVVLGQPPPPPPPDIPALKASAEKNPASLREALTAHRADSACAGCHNRIDPLGFALEAFDATGMLRDGPVDNAGRLPDGSSFAGHGGLKVLLQHQKEGEFIRHFAGRLLVYALGRELTFNDERALQIILQGLARNGYSAQSLVREIVSSYPFQYSKQPQAGNPSR
jgi:hypothetical protein